MTTHRHGGTSRSRASFQLELPLETTVHASARSASVRKTRGTGESRPKRRGWRLDEDTRRIGREGVAAARALLERGQSEPGRATAGPASLAPPSRPERAA